jgi:Ca2+-binding EF-hand superfamily protein
MYNTCPDFNIMDAFRALDTDGKGYITQLELATGLLELEIHYTQAEIDSFIRYFDIENTKRIKFSDFGKAFLPNNRDFSLKIL